MGHKLEEVTEPFKDVNGDPIDRETPLVEDNQIKVEFTMESDGEVQNISSDSFKMIGYDLLTETKVWTVDGTITDGPNGKVEFTVSPTENDTAGDFVFEIRHDIGDDGTRNNTLHGRHEIKENADS